MFTLPHTRLDRRSRYAAAGAVAIVLGGILLATGATTTTTITTAAAPADGRLFPHVGAEPECEGWVDPPDAVGECVIETDLDASAPLSSYPEPDAQRPDYAAVTAYVSVRLLD
jgi:hypothetical protein